MNVLQARLTGPQRVELVDTAIEPQPTQLVVRNLACGICHSEKAGWLSGAGGIGHEPVGEIVEVGRLVDGPWQVGQRVTGYWAPACATYSAADPQRLLPVPDNVPTEHALGEVLACLVTCARGWSHECGDDLALVGCGFMGVLSMRLVAATGATVTAIDLLPERLAFAARNGATHTVRADDQPVEQVREITGGRMCHLVTESSGSGAGLDLAVRLVGGFRPVLNLVSYLNREVTLANLSWLANGTVIRNPHPSYSPNLMDDLRVALQFASRGHWDLNDAITHRWPLADVDTAYRQAMTGVPGYLKGVVTMA